MSFSPYKRPILPEAITDLAGRLKTYKNGPHYKAAVRNPAYCILKWDGGKKGIPQDTDKWNDTYRKSRHQKPAPALKSVNLTLGANENQSLAIEADFTIKIFTKDDFSDTVDSLCKLGNLLEFDWGYKNPFGDGYASGRSIKGFKLCGFTFNTEPDGTYIIEGKAVGPGVALQGLNANFRIDPNGNPARPTGQRKYKNENKSYLVTGIVELLTYWAQGNGKKSIDKMEDGEVLVVPSGATSDGKPQPMGTIIIYDSEHLVQKGLLGSFSKIASNLLTVTNELNKTNNIIYISLETIVGLFNSEIFPMYNLTTLKTPENGVDFKKLKIMFDDKLSFSYIDTNIRSAYPTKVLILDETLGDYKNSAGEGKNFWEDAKNKTLIKAVESKSGQRAKIDLKRIYIERSVVLSALDGTHQKQSPASLIDTRVNRDASINVDEFFKRIFDEIKVATGDRISLVLSMHPEVFDADDSKAYNLYVFDETNGYDSPPKYVWRFNPIDGDGTTRSFSIKSDIGSQNYQLSQYYGPTTTTDVMARTRGLQALVDAARAANRSKALIGIKEIIKDPGTLGDSAFDAVHMQALKGHFVALKDSEAQKTIYNNLTFIGLGADVELDGVWGIGPGSGIWSTQMPNDYEKNHIYFHVMSTTHRFDGDTSDWATIINAIVCTHEEVDYFPKADGSTK